MCVGVGGGGGPVQALLSLGWKFPEGPRRPHPCVWRGRKLAASGVQGTESRAARRGRRHIWNCLGPHSAQVGGGGDHTSHPHRAHAHTCTHRGKHAPLLPPGPPRQLLGRAQAATPKLRLRLPSPGGRPSRPSSPPLPSPPPCLGFPERLQLSPDVLQRRGPSPATSRAPRSRGAAGPEPRAPRGAAPGAQRGEPASPAQCSDYLFRASRVQ